ncbi:hypothetical protein GCM10007036_14330 [Alsobacter metallidurans]|uniref:Uncharacterized protein n=1 Tax=Alsobacter metallidurans TaxID=340221 RepID=A0A917I4X1_9HYPH|nr:hypothetical protein GCM10007036_14330 [Alsobacter metallidurans]
MKVENSWLSVNSTICHRDVASPTAAYNVVGSASPTVGIGRRWYSLAGCMAQDPGVDEKKRDEVLKRMLTTPPKKHETEKRDEHARTRTGPRSKSDGDRKR